MDLDKWIEKTTKDIVAAQNLVQNISNEVNGIAKSQNLPKLESAIHKVETELDGRAKDLQKWKAAAEKVLQGTIEKGYDVHKNMDPTQQKDPPGGTVIGRNIKKINEAKTAVEGVNAGLQTVHQDLQTWNTAAQNVLRTAVSKAQGVHTRLDPNKQDNGHILGKSIDEIDTARKGLVEANSKLDTQVKSLDKWITDAEKIRDKAEKKAKEAYDKLKVNAELSNNVQKIVDANKKIASVHTELGKVHGNLGEWKQQAGDVLQGAINNAQFVYDRLGDGQPVSQGIDKIESNNSLIKDANEKLGTEVENLGNWRDAAKDVISKADGKCDEILKKVNKSGYIYVNAQELQDKGNKLYNAAKQAKDEVGKKVTEALNAVVEMDTSLKRDLYKVREDIKKGITEVIEDLNVTKLDEKVQTDLQELRERILRLKEKVDEVGDGSLVKEELDTLRQKKSDLDSQTINKITKAEKQLEPNFTSKIQSPLSKAVGAVDQAIGTLGGNFKNGGDLNSLQSIFDHIKGEVGKIKGKAGISWDNKGGSGLDGIAHGLISSYADAFKNTFHTIVGGWAEGILGKDKDDTKPPKKWLEKYVQDNGGKGKEAVNLLNGTILGFSWSQKIIEQIKTKLHSEIEAGKGKVDTSSGKIEKTITSVKNACEAFVSGLDEKLKNDGFNQLAQEIYDKIANESRWKAYRSNRRYNKENEIEPAIKAALIGLSATASQVANEIDSILLGEYRMGGNGSGKSIASELDRVLDETKKLHTALEGAIDNSGSSTPKPGTAQAVDSRLKEVSRQVEGLTNTFTSKVTSELTKAVNQLPGAVTDFDTEAQKLIKAAAKTAIDKAAEQISNGGTITLGSTNKLMEEFDRSHKNITANLQKQLNDKVDDHIGKDDKSGGTGGEINIKSTFGNYDNHVVQTSEGLHPGKALKGEHSEGSLPLAIGDIKAQVYNELKMIEPGTTDKVNKIELSTFTGPFGLIKKELEGIKKLVENKDAQPPGKDADGVRDLLKKLEQGLNEEKFDGADKGLEKIREMIEKLQKDPFGTQPEAIGTAVEQIKAQLKELREKLKKEQNGGTENGVIDVLDDLKENGLGDKAGWSPINVNGQPLSGLGKIESELKTQNAILPTQTKIIAESLDIVFREMKGVLGQIGMKLDNIFIPDDVMDNLTLLKHKIGRNTKYGDSLQVIHNEIQQLQSVVFTQKPLAIHQANSAIKGELKDLQGVLQGSKPGKDVIKSLEDLQSNGLSGDKVWNVNGQDKKGLKSIESDLKGQQTTLSTQPQNIQTGVDQITGELTKLQKQLSDDVTKKLDDLKNHGLGSKQNWDIDEHSAKGLTKITEDIVAIKDRDVDQVKEKLKELCTAIRHIAKDAAFTLKEVKEKSLNELTGIKDQLHNLQIRLERGPIQACREFIDRDADRFGRECIAFLTAFVNGQVTTAIEDLTAFAKQQCASNIKEALEAFARKVEEELNPLPPLINEDLQMGYKGFMYDFQQRFESHISPLKGTLQLDALSTAFKRFQLALSGYLSTEIKRVHSEESKKKNPSLPPSEDHYAERLYQVTHALEELLEHITMQKRFDRRLPGMLDKLAEAVGSLRPEKFAKVTTPILDGVAEAADKFEKELRTAYISTYDGAFEGRVLYHAAKKTHTPEATKCAFVLLTITDTLFRDLNELRMKCADEWSHMLINPFTPLGAFLQQRGYRVTSAGVPDGELRNDSDCSGQKIRELTDNIMEPLDELHDMLKCYLRLCHLRVPPEPRYPGTVRDILAWFAGLPYSVLYERVQAHCNVLFRGEGDAVVKHCLLCIPGALGLVTHHSSTLLVTICGNGRGFDHADYPYACNFWDNSRGLHYPSDLADLLHMLTHLCKCLLLALNFLRARCKYDASTGHGWRDCRYGRSVPAASWQCNKHLMCEPNGRPTCRPNGQPMCQSTCQPKSPLQAHLMDHLAGFLPHKLASVGCDSQCDTCSIASPGMPCVTPMGFWDLPDAGSIVGSGEQICAVLTALCSGAESPLPTLLRCLSSIDPSPPQSLGDMFAFYCNVFRCRQSAEYVDNVHFTGHLSTAAIPSVSLYLCPTTQAAQLTNALTRLHHSPDDHSGASPTDAATNTLQATHSDLSSLTVRSRCADSLTCAPTSNRSPSTPTTPSPRSTRRKYCRNFRTQLSQVVHSNHFANLFRQIDELLYCIRMPFLLCLAALWVIATLYISHTVLYRMDVLRIRSHLLTTRASHLIDVKALLAGSRRMLSLYKDVDYFDDDVHP
ncbi:Extracellular matrix-binding ebh, putative [Babesia ovata]|uniref:Extracellular matrix-binding ebh, putative n=1 Tax=Babesia ovata TaxID=189622 RepID=A0A2H6KIN5_9APIC|nr:Extracellular matrix-binding ebh, putative [Babesia ovata]GBE62847.1 Extracellular matrix-binding ebh, putative [Babesia ovata]